MSSTNTHIKVKELFLRALELAPSEREAFLAGSGAGTEVLEQVRELLRNTSTATVLDVKSDLFSSKQHPVSRFIPYLSALAPFASSRRRQWITGLILLTIFVICAQVLRKSTRDLAEAQALSTVRAIQESNSSAFLDSLQDWVAEAEVTVADEWAHGAAIEAIRDPSAENLLVFHNEVRGLLAPDRFQSYFLVDENGIFKSLNGVKVDPSSATPYGMSMFSRALNSGSFVDAPGLKRPLSLLKGQGELLPSVVIYVPVMDGEQPVGVFAAMHSMRALSQILERTQLFATGESYIFSDDGLMLSPGRFLKDMRHWGLVREPEVEGGLPLVYLRDPGRSLAKTDGLNEGEEPASWPVALSVRSALAGRDSGDTSRLQGLLRQPYRNYRGEMVVTSWRWSPELGIGFATDVDAGEVYAVADLVDRSSLVLLGLIAIAGAWIIVTSGWLMRLRGEVERRHELGQYSLIEKIGEGGMGEVYLARHALLKRTSALKLLRRDRATENSFLQFENEVQIVSQLRHPNTVEVYDFGRANDGTFYYVMQYLPGLDLGEWLQRSGKMPPARALHVIRQICSALSEAHEEGLLHRDVKPSNVMLCSMGGMHDFAKLLDFGLAQAVHQTGELSGPQDRSGTPYFTAPERLQPQGIVDARCDIYSLGVLWYYLLTAQLPHGEEVHWVEATLSMDPTPISSLLELDEETARLVMSCLARDKDQRPRSTTTLLAELSRLSVKMPWSDEDAKRSWDEVNYG